MFHIFNIFVYYIIPMGNRYVKAMGNRYIKTAGNRYVTAFYLFTI